MINLFQRLAITLLIFSSLSNITSAQMTDKAEFQSGVSKSQTKNPPGAKLSSLPAKAKQSSSKCISNCSLPNAKSIPLLKVEATMVA